jgi:predicted dehydrogenase
MKGILVGLGSAGFSWYKRLRDRGLLAAVVEVDPEMKEKMGNDPFPFYTSLEEALAVEQADFLVNVTSPSAHTRVNIAAFDRKLPVLCEKPISFDYEDSLNVVTLADKELIPFMIAENYRRWPYIRKMKQLLDQGAIGRICAIDIYFYRYHHVQRKYTVSILDDIGVHHFDLIRYLTGCEGERIQGKIYNPPASWREPGATVSAHALLELEDGVMVSYAASITSRGKETPWSGNWRIDGSEGAMELIDKEIYITKDGETRHVNDLSGVDETDTLDEFIASLQEGREAETSGKDYIKTQALVHFAKLSSISERTEQIIVPVI